MFAFFVDGANEFEIKGKAWNDYVRKSKCLSVEKARVFECQRMLEICLKKEVALWRSHARKMMLWFGERLIKRCISRNGRSWMLKKTSMQSSLIGCHILNSNSVWTYNWNLRLFIVVVIITTHFVKLMRSLWLFLKIQDLKFYIVVCVVFFHPYVVSFQSWLQDMWVCANPN